MILSILRSVRVRIAFGLTLSCILPLVFVAPADAAPTATSRVSEYGYPESVEYRVVPNAIAVKFSNPASVAKVAKVDLKGTCASLEYKGTLDTAKSIARFNATCSKVQKSDGKASTNKKQKGSANSAGSTASGASKDSPCSEAQLMLAARTVVDKLKDAVAGGLLIDLETGERVILTDDLIVQFDHVKGPGLSALGNYEFRTADPSLSGFGFLYRLVPASDPVRSLVEVADDVKAKNVARFEPRILRLEPGAIAKGFNAWLKQQQQNFTGSVSLSFAGNESVGKEDHKLSTDIALSRGIYPGQLRVSAGAEVRLRDDEVSEDVTKILVNYDYYFEDWLEVYGFLERFTNSFLGISERYEGGVGMNLEWDLKRKRSPWFEGGLSYLVYDDPARRKTSPRRWQTFCDENDARRREILVDRQTQKYLDHYREVMRDELFTGPQITKHKEEYCHTLPAILKKRSRLQFGIAASLFGDFEKPATREITVRLKEDESVIAAGPELSVQEGVAAEDSEAITGKFTPPSSFDFRLTVRPTITFRPNDRIELHTHYYWKQALEGLDETGGGLFEDSADVRTEFEIGGKMVLAKDHTGAEKVSLELKATEYHNRRPPSISAEQALVGLNLVPEGMEVSDVVGQYEFENLSAPRNHTVYKFSLSVSW